LSRRGDISDSALRVLCAAALAAAVGWMALLPDLPHALHAPGSPTLQSVAILGAALLLVPVAYALAKRSPRTRAPAAWASAHALAALAGGVLVSVHAAGRLLEPPALLLLNLLALMALGLWARIGGARRMANTFATKHSAFTAADPELRGRLAGVIADKRRALAALDAGATEGTFSVTLGHWLAHPGAARRYAALARKEAQLMGQRASVGRVQAWWRVLHLLLALVFVLGLAVHVILVTFFAGWVADGGEVYWWHVSDWGR
jgi:hypothetical protein